MQLKKNTHSSRSQTNKPVMPSLDYWEWACGLAAGAPRALIRLKEEAE